MPKSKTIKAILSNVITQILPVMIGVYLGFALNNYGESRKEKKQASMVQTMILEEIKENLSSINHVSKYHLKLSKDLDSLGLSPQLEKDFNYYDFRGLQPGFVNSSSYQTALQTGVIQRYDLKFVQVINRLYTLQDRYEKFNASFLETFLGQKFPESNEEIQSLLKSVRMGLNDVNNFEENLLEMYQFILNKYDIE